MQYLSLIHISDIIIPEGGYNQVALDMLNEKIHALLKERM